MDLFVPAREGYRLLRVTVAGAVAAEHSGRGWPLCGAIIHEALAGYRVTVPDHLLVPGGRYTAWISEVQPRSPGEPLTGSGVSTPR